MGSLKLRLMTQDKTDGRTTLDMETKWALVVFEMIFPKKSLMRNTTTKKYLGFFSQFQFPSGHPIKKP